MHVETWQCHEFRGPYAERGDAIAELLDAVSCGATLEFTGPTIDRDEVKGWIESATGARHAQATGSAIGPVLVELARKWKHTSTIPSPPIEPGERYVRAVVDLIANNVKCNCDASGPAECELHGPRE